ncbi:MAG: hypothetical protein RJA36_1803 [Pseudomonadota bacterium]|jgi:hypothetical protein
MSHPLILFGAFDRHNFGDLLLAHLAVALLPQRELVFAGLAERDLRPWGGHAVRALAALAPEVARRGADLLHVGGEILGCSAWQAAVMLQPLAQVQPLIAYLQERPHERAQWVEAVIGTDAQAPYVVARARLPGLRRCLFHGVGGAGLEDAPAPLRAEVLAALRAADALSVRDRCTLATLAAAGVGARLVPDPAVRVAELFGRRIARRARQGEVADVIAGLAGGYVALQISAEFADDASLAALAAQLDALALATGLGVALFRAGGAPWHDELDPLQRLAVRLRTARARVLRSLDLWDICALIACSRAYAGSSLHGRLVATAYALPRLSLLPPQAGGQAAKLMAYLASWEAAGLPACAPVTALAAALQQAMAASPQALRRQALTLEAASRGGWEALAPILDGPTRA